MTKKASDVLLTSQQRADINMYCDDLLEVYSVTRSAEILINPELADQPDPVSSKLIKAVKDCKFDIMNYDPTSHFVSSYYASEIIEFFIRHYVVPESVIRKFAKKSEETGKWMVEKEDQMRKEVGLSTTLGQQILFMSMIQSRVFVLWMNEYFIQSGSIRSRLTSQSLIDHISTRYTTTGVSSRTYEASANTIAHQLKALLSKADLEKQTLRMAVPKGWTPSTYQFNNGLLTFDQQIPQLSNFDENTLDYRFAYQRVNATFEARPSQQQLIDNAINAISSRTNDLISDEKTKKAHIFNWSLDALQDLHLPGRSACVFMISARNTNGGTGKSFMYSIIQNSLNKSIKIGSYQDAVEQQRNHRSNLMEQVVGSLGFNADEELVITQQSLQDKYQFNDLSNKSLYYAPLGTNGSHHRLLGVHRSATNCVDWGWVDETDTAVIRRFWEDTYPANVASMELNPLGTGAVKDFDDAMKKGIVTQTDLLYYLFEKVMSYGFNRNDYNFEWESGQEILTRIGQGEIRFDDTVSDNALASIVDDLYNKNRTAFTELLGGIPNIGQRSLENQGFDKELHGSAGTYLELSQHIRTEFGNIAKQHNLINKATKSLSANKIIDIALDFSDKDYLTLRNSTSHKQYLIILTDETPEAPTDRSKALEQAKEEYVEVTPETPVATTEDTTEQPISNTIDFDMKLTKLPSIYDNYNAKETYATTAQDLVGVNVPKDKQEIVLVNDRFDRKDHSGTSNVLFLDFDDIVDWDKFNQAMDETPVKTIVQESASSSEAKRKAHVFVPLEHPLTADQYPIVQAKFISEFGIPAELDLNQRGFKGVFYLSHHEPVERGILVWNNPEPIVEVSSFAPKTRNGQSATSTYDGPQITHIASFMTMSESKAVQWYMALTKCEDMNAYDGQRNNALTIIAKDICGLLNIGKMTEKVFNQIVEELSVKMENDNCNDSLVEFEEMLERFMA